MFARSVIGLVLVLLTVGPARSEPVFTFVALGDMPYGPAEKSYPPFERLIGAVNAAAPAFTLHVGDIKSGGTPCSDEEFRNQLAFMNSFDAPLVYTPGDNEWTDCHRERAGGFDPLERLETLRRMFFTKPESLGRTKMPLEWQPAVHGGAARYVENSRWTRDGVQFVTVHVVGSNNGFETRDRAAAEEYFDRSDANRLWLEDTFHRAGQEDAAAMVVVFHADPFNVTTPWSKFPAHSGFAGIAKALMEGAVAFGKPVLLIHGDSHVFIIDKPFTFRDLGGQKGRGVIQNLTRLQVFGAADVHAVEVSVTPGESNPFAFRPIYNPGD